MADRRVVIEQYLVDGTTPSQRAAVDSSGRVSVNLTASSATVTVDTELPAAAALADGASNPTTPTVGAAGLLWNGSTWDRRKSVAAAQDTTGTGIAAVGIQAQLDDTSTTTVTENQFANLRMSSRRALLVEGVASGTNLNVNLAASAATVTVDSELPAAAALADATSNPTVPGVGGFLMGYNGTTWDRVRTANTGRLQVDVVTGGGSNASVLVDNAGFTDGTSSVTAVGMIFDEVAGTALTENDVAAPRIDSKRAQVQVIEDATTRGQRLAVDASGRASVSLTASSATVTVDSELPAAAALADATSNPTVPGVGGFLMGYNGTTWDRVRTANTGRLQVDVITGGGSDTPTSPTNSYNTAAGVSAGSTSNHDTSDLGGSTRKVAKVIFSSSVPLKAELVPVSNGTPGTTLAVGFSPAGGMGELVPSHRDYWSTVFSANAGFDGFRVIRTNLDGSDAADVYSVIQYEA